MNSFELAKEFLASRRYRIVEEDSTDGHISFRYQMNTIHFWGSEDDEKFLVVTLTNFTEVTEENLAQVKENCHQINREVKLVKLYTINDCILAAAENYYMAAEDFNFQFKNALGHLVAAKVMYQKLEE